MTCQGSEGLFSPFLRSQRLKAARPFIKGRVLDVGCGMGELANVVPADRYMGVDVDEQTLVIARKFHPQHIFQSFLPPAQPAFDTVVALAVVEHVECPGRFLGELALRLKDGPDNFIVCTTPYPRFKWAHEAGARIGLFSNSAAEEHKEFLDRTRLLLAASEAELKMIYYRRFLFGANQLAVFQRGDL